MGQIQPGRHFKEEQGVERCSQALRKRESRVQPESSHWTLNLVQQLDFMVWRSRPSSVGVSHAVPVQKCPGTWCPQMMQPCKLNQWNVVDLFESNSKPKDSLMSPCAILKLGRYETNHTRIANEQNIECCAHICSSRSKEGCTLASLMARRLSWLDCLGSLRTQDLAQLGDMQKAPPAGKTATMASSIVSKAFLELVRASSQPNCCSLPVSPLTETFPPCRPCCTLSAKFAAVPAAANSEKDVQKHRYIRIVRIKAQQTQPSFRTLPKVDVLERPIS